MTITDQIAARVRDIVRSVAEPRVPAIVPSPAVEPRDAARSEIEDFEAALESHLGAWRINPTPAHKAIMDAAMMILDLRDSASILPQGRDVLVTGEVLLRYVGKHSGPQGDRFHGLLFSTPLTQALAWMSVPDEGHYYPLRWRGSAQELERVALNLVLVGEAVLENLAAA